ncbi:hypothetical protein ABT354_19760 [Streptomyces sp. NPDC000594]|uniref:hypothetical protein n=1 Tax=Streptomyces sp. NPDC000594 TaxID=3154261 RepID=UPI00332273FA
MSSTARRANQKAVTGGSKQEKETTGPSKKAATPNKHLIVPDLDFDGGDDDDDDDDYGPPKFEPSKKDTATPAPALPQQVEKEQLLPVVAEPEVAEPAAPVAVLGEAGIPQQPEKVQAPQEPAAVDVPERATAPAAPQHQPVIEGAPRQEERAEPEPTAAIEGSSEPLPKHPDVLLGDPVQPASVDNQVQRLAGQVGGATVPGSALAPTRFSDGTRGGHATATEVYGGSTGGSLQVRRPGRRRVREPFNPELQPSGPTAAMLEMAERAPGYAALLTVYSAAQTKMEPFGDRNIHLYGLTADDAGLQVVSDKALLKTISGHEPKLTLAHYVDAALEPALAPLNPSGTDRQEMEDERDYVWQLAQGALKYRRYVLSDPQTAALPKYRAKSLLRTPVNERFTRMLNLIDSLAGINAKPFEIVSAIVAGYLEKLPTEQDSMKKVFEKHLMTSIH